MQNSCNSLASDVIPVSASSDFTMQDIDCALARTHENIEFIVAEEDTENLRRALAEAKEEIQALRESDAANRQQLKSMRKELYSVQVELSNFANFIQAEVSFKGMAVRAAKLPFKLIRKIYRLGLAVGRFIASSEVRAEWRLELPRRIEAWKAVIWPPPTAEEVVFNGIFEENRWGSQESISGEGSTLDGTEIIRRELPRIVERFKIKKILDLPCGDFNWMRHVELGVKRYVGGDIVQEIVTANKAKYGRWGRKFKWMNLIESRLPKADLLLCRDCLVHLSFEDIQKVLDNLHRSKIKYLLTTTYTNRPVNFNIPTGMWVPRNLQAEPFNFPAPLLSINENCRESYPDFNDKSLALWRIEDLPRSLDISWKIS